MAKSQISNVRKIRQPEDVRLLGFWMNSARQNFRLLELSPGVVPWRNLKVVRTVRRETVRKLKSPGKCNWYLGWNGERLARSADADLLAKHYPNIYAWVIETLIKDGCRS